MHLSIYLSMYIHTHLRYEPNISSGHWSLPDETSRKLPSSETPSYESSRR